MPSRMRRVARSCPGCVGRAPTARSPVLPRRVVDTTDLVQASYRPDVNVYHSGDWGYPQPGSRPHGLENHALGPLPVPLSIEDALPRPEVQLSGGDRDDDLVADGQGTEMGRGIVLSRA